jgi:uncharacterized protein (DUF305 family)
MTIRTPLAVGALVLAATLGLGACSDDDHGSMDGSMDGPAMDQPSAATASIPADATFNATDVGFAQGMIPHHAQAIVMADMALDQSTDPDVTRLATAIKAAQAPEIDQMTTWLEDWGQPVPETYDGMGHSMEGMEGMMMSGMMSGADMERLGEAEGSTFDTMWLELMIQHHEGAVTMAEDVLADGKAPEVAQLAQAIIDAQQAEIAEMEALLAALPA